MATLQESADETIPTRPPGDMLFLGAPFTKADALAAGLTIKRLRGLLEAGLARTVLKGVFIDAAAEDTPSMRAVAVFKVAPARSIITDETSAWVQGAHILGPSGRDALPPIDVFRVAASTRLRRTGCHSGTRTLDLMWDVKLIGELVVTTPLRTALDLGRLRRRYDAMAAIDALMRVGVFTVHDLEAELPRFKGARGVIQLRQLVPLADPRSESPAESRVRLQIIDGGLPTPEVQWEVRNEVSVLIYRLDLAYPDIKLAIEYDGEEFHTSKADRAYDRERRAYLRALGWTIVVLRKEHVYGSNPTTVARVRSARDLLLAAN